MTPYVLGSNTFHYLMEEDSKGFNFLALRLLIRLKMFPQNIAWSCFRIYTWTFPNDKGVYSLLWIPVRRWIKRQETIVDFARRFFLIIENRLSKSLKPGVVRALHIMGHFRENTKGGKKYYTLLAHDKDQLHHSKKLIDVLSLSKRLPVFGFLFFKNKDIL